MRKSIPLPLDFPVAGHQAAFRMAQQTTAPGGHWKRGRVSSLQPLWRQTALEEARGHASQQVAQGTCITPYWACVTPPASLGSRPTCFLTDVQGTREQGGKPTLKMNSGSKMVAVSPESQRESHVFSLDSGDILLLIKTPRMEPEAAPFVLSTCAHQAPRCRHIITAPHSWGPITLHTCPLTGGICRRGRTLQVFLNVTSTISFHFLGIPCQHLAGARW